MPILLVALCMAIFPSASGAENTATAPEGSLHLRHAAVASDSEPASAAGVELLKSGGNAVDAACATALALGVVHPFASGLGGGGFALLYLAKTGKTVALDFRETAPLATTGARPVPAQSGLSIGVPGEPRGLAELVRRFGALPFSRCVEPALRLARGFRVSPWLARQIGDEIARNPTSGPDLVAKVLEMDSGAAVKLHAGDRVARPLLARTLRRLRAGGADVFYRGAIARAIVAAAVTAGSAISLDDLARYAPVERTPIETDFLGHRVLGMPPPSAGGVIIAQALGVVADKMATLDRHDGPLAPGYLHLLVEAEKHGFADRARFLADPAFAPVPLDHLLDPAYHHELASRIHADRVLPHGSYGTAPPAPAAPARDAGTAHVSVVDRAGNAVALTTTINLEFGARVVADGTGIVLNDELDDFTRVPGQPDIFALSGGAANRPEPGKRPLSSMAPTIVVGERGVELVTGSAGGPRIVSATLQIVLDVLLFGASAQQAVLAPRIHHQWEPDTLFHEPGLPAETVRALGKKGHRTELRPDIGKANAIARTRSGLDAASDPRAGGAPAGY
jgi:gamma-glutamyltranspeptidase / glutathione hydrolase